jgi:hypothetical protein
MKNYQRILASVVVRAIMLILCLGFNSVMAAPAPAPAAAVKDLNVSDPYCSDNLAVYLIRGPEKLKGAKILTLEEALREKLVVIEETSNVNELKVQNKSDCVVFLQSGDIVRGGRQDRTVQYDMMLSPRSGKVPLPCFCVEHGRWQQRGQESAGSFDSSVNYLASKNLKLAAKKYGDQGSVWNNVAAVQGKLAEKVGASVCAAPSPTSLELTMENKNVKAATQKHLDKLAGITKGQRDVIGYAFAINGKINSADVYASNELFNKLWPKLLKSTAAEAVADADKKATKVHPKPAEIKQFLVDAENKPAVSKAGDKQYAMLEQESARSIKYQTNWMAAPGRASHPAAADLHVSAPSVEVHANYINK